MEKTGQVRTTNLCHRARGLVMALPVILSQPIPARLLCASPLAADPHTVNPLASFLSLSLSPFTVKNSPWPSCARAFLVSPPHLYNTAQNTQSREGMANTKPLRPALAPLFQSQQLNNYNSLHYLTRCRSSQPM